MGMKTVVPYGLLCTGLAPVVSPSTRAGGLAIDTESDDEQRQALQDAADSCPTQAITVAD